MHQRPWISPDPLLIFGPDDVSLEPGDVFGTENPSWWLGKPIAAAEKVHSRDNQAIYTHSGIIVNPEGDTVESLWTVSSRNIWKAYAGKRIIIARWEWLTRKDYKKGWAEVIMKHWKKKYPWWRLPLQLVPPLAKYLSFTGMPVCSELVAKFLHYIGARHNWWSGTNPDTLADEWMRWKGFTIIEEGLIITQ